MKRTITPILTTMALAAALVSGPAAAINWTTPITVFEDDDIDFHYIDVGSDGIIGIGDVLVAVFELNTASGVDIGPSQELTGVSAIELAAVADLDGIGGVNDMIFAPYAAGLDTVLALGGAGPVTGGAAGGGAIVAMYLDNTPDLEVASGSPISCASLATCITQATDGALWEVDGFAGDPDESWTALNAQTNVALAANTLASVGTFNAGLSILDNQTGRELVTNSLSCFPFCGLGGDGFTDIVGIGALNGGLLLPQALKDDNAFAFSDFDLLKAPLPEPGILALMGLGLLGMNGIRRRNRNS